MNKYECIYIFSPLLDLIELKKIIKKIKKNILKYDGNVLEIKNLGIKKFSYKILNFYNAYYVVMTFEIKNIFLKKIKDFIKNNKKIIIRFMLIRKN